MIYKINKGDRISIDKGICGTDTGRFVETSGWSAFGFFGIYRSDKDNKEHGWDEMVHKVSPLPIKPKEV